MDLVLEFRARTFQFLCDAYFCVPGNSKNETYPNQAELSTARVSSPGDVILLIILTKQKKYSRSLD